MLLDDAFQHRGMAAMIPDRFRVNDGDGATDANPEATGLGAVNQRFGTHQIEFFEPLFKVFPSDDGLVAGTAFGFVGICTQENVPAIGFQTQLLGGGLEFFVHDKIGRSAPV